METDENANDGRRSDLGPIESDEDVKDTTTKCIVGFEIIIS